LQFTDDLSNKLFQFSEEPLDIFGGWEGCNGEEKKCIKK
jgi:hypothetical protein